MGSHVDRALLLLRQGRYDMAEESLQRELAAAPDDPFPHALLALCRSERKQHASAIEEAKSAVSGGPDNAYYHYVLAQVLHAADRNTEALRSVEEAIRLDPEDAAHFSLLGSLRFEKKDWNGALKAAEEGLSKDPENVSCANLRAMALVQLGRSDAARDALGSALEKDPENALTHANRGWALIHERKYRQSMESFREALRLDPTLDWAREGIVTALKAHNVIYGAVLRYYLWMSKLSTKTQWLVLIGGMFLVKALGNVQKGNPAIAPYTTPIIWAYFAFVLLTWIADPVFNLLLRLHPFGAPRLDEEGGHRVELRGGTPPRRPHHLQLGDRLQEHVPRADRRGSRGHDDSRRGHLQLGLAEAHLLARSLHGRARPRRPGSLRARHARSPGGVRSRRYLPDGMGGVHLGVPVHPVDGSAVGRLRITAVVPALNEEGRIEAALRSLRAGGVDEIILVDGGSRDATRARAEPLADLVLDSDPGLFRQLDAGAARASGDIILFHYADVLFPAAGRAAVDRALEDPGVVGGAFRLAYPAERPLFRLVALGARVRNRLGIGPFGDQSIFIRAEIFRALGASRARRSSRMRTSSGARGGRAASRSSRRPCWHRPGAGTSAGSCARLGATPGSRSSTRSGRDARDSRPSGS